MTTLLKLIGILFSGIILLSTVSCKKSEDPSSLPSFSLKFSTKALSYIKLTEGKYFIYKDSATLTTDSVIVTKSKLENIFTPQNTSGWITVPAHNSENFSLTLTKYAGSVQSEWFSGAAVTNYTFPFASTDTFAVTLTETAGLPVFYMAESDQPNYSVTIEGKLYNNIVTTIFTNGLDISNPLYKKTYFFWANGTGIIKRTIITTGGTIKTYTLLRSN